MPVERSRVFFDITIDGELAGRIVFELYDDICPITAQNFLKLCTGQAGTGKTTGKPLTYQHSLIHRVVKNFMIQGGDFSAGNGTGGESIYGGVFDDENFEIKHDQPFILSMANRGPDTNGSQFFITTNATTHLNNVHVAFGRVISGQEIVTRIEQLKVNAKSRPVNDVVISACGQLVKKKAENAEDEDEIDAKQKKKKRKHKRSESVESEAEKKQSQEKENAEKDDHFSTVKPEDLPQVPETNSFLMRRSPPKNTESKRSEAKQESGQRRRSRSPRNRPKVRGRGRLMYQSPSRLGSTTPPHWKREVDRLIPMNKLKEIQEKQRKEVEEREMREAVREVPREAVREEEPTRQQDTFGYRNQQMFEQRRHKESREDHRHDYGSSRNRHEDRHQRSPKHDVQLHYDQRSSRRHEDRHRKRSREERQKYDSRTESRSHRERSREREPRQQENDQMLKYEQRRKRRPSDIEREMYRKGDLANVNPSAPSYQTESNYQSSTSAYPSSYGTNSHYSLQAPGYQNGQSYDHASLIAAAAQYAKATTASHYSTASVPHGHYSTVPSNQAETKKRADLPDSYIVETETSIQPLQDWSADHKRTKRTHEVIENERTILPSRSDRRPEKSSRSDRRRDSPPSKHRRDRHRRSSTSSSSSSSSSSASSNDRRRRRDSRDRNYRRR